MSPKLRVVMPAVDERNLIKAAAFLTLLLFLSVCFGAGRVNTNSEDGAAETGTAIPYNKKKKKKEKSPD